MQRIAEGFLFESVFEKDGSQQCVASQLAFVDALRSLVPRL